MSDGQIKINEMLEVIKLINQKGWSPGSSTNYSYRSGDHFMISRSGVDKQYFKGTDLIGIDSNKNVLPDYQGEGIKPSAETDLHLMLMQNPEVNAVVHSHSSNAITLSVLNFKAKELVFTGLEMLKGFSGNSTHEMTEVIPIFPNSQDMGMLKSIIEPYLSGNPGCHGFLLEGHGLYTWGASIPDAKRHAEVWESLFEFYHLSTLKRS